MGRRSIIQKSEISLAQLAQSAGANGATIAANQSANINPTQLGPAATVSFAAPAITLTTGKRFRISVSISGLASALDLTGTVTILKNGSAFAGSPNYVTAAGHATADIAGGFTWMDENPGASAVTYSVQLAMGSGTVTVPVGQASIVVEERN